MSGGSIGNYEWFSMNELATEIEDFANKNEYGYSVGTIYEFVKTAKMLREVASRVKSIDYLVACDIGEESFQKEILEFFSQ